jgi:uncharacterized protein
MKNQSSYFKRILKMALWIVAIQLILVNVSAALHAYKFTHFYDLPAPKAEKGNVFTKTWRLFAGPVIYKKPTPETWDQFREISLVTSTGLKTEAWYLKKDSSKGCIIFVHGVTSNKAFFINETSRFLDWGYSVCTVDLRGHGDAPGNNSTFGVNETEEVKAAFDFIKSEGHDKIILYGASMGAAVVIKTVSEKLVEPAGIITDMPFASLHHHFKSRVRTLGFPSEPFASLVTFWTGVERGYNGFGHDIRDYAKNIKCPVMVEWGDRDHLVKEEEIVSIYQNIPSKKKRLLIYSGADHHSYLFTHPLQWEKNVREFSDGL